MILAAVSDLGNLVVLEKFQKIAVLNSRAAAEIAVEDDHHQGYRSDQHKHPAAWEHRPGSPALRAGGLGRRT